MFQYSLTGKDGSGSCFGSWKTVPAVPVPLSVSGKTVPTVPVPGAVRFPSHPDNLGPGQHASTHQILPDWSARCPETLTCFHTSFFSGRNYVRPPPLPPISARRPFSGRGGGVYFEAPAAGFYTPPTPRRIFSGVGGWGCIKFGPIFLPPLLATRLPPLFWAPFRAVLPLEKCSVLQSKGHNTELGEGQLRDGALRKVQEGNSFPKSA